MFMSLSVLGSFYSLWMKIGTFGLFRSHMAQDSRVAPRCYEMRSCFLRTRGARASLAPRRYTISVVATRDDVMQAHWCRGTASGVLRHCMVGWACVQGLCMVVGAHTRLWQLCAPVAAWFRCFFFFFSHFHPLQLRIPTK